MTDSYGAQGTFIVGCPRSGTTLVQALLATQPGTTSFTESHFFDGHFRNHHWGPWDFTLLARPVALRLRTFLQENGFDTRLQSLQGIPSGRHLLPFYTLEALHGFLDLLDELAAARGRMTWLEKTPSHLYFTRFIERNLRPTDRIRFVHTVRSGADVVASLYTASKNWPSAYSIEDCIDRWNSDTRLTMEALKSPLHDLVFYEDLVTNPVGEISRLQNWLGQRFDAEALEKNRKVAEQLVTAEESWKANVFQEIKPRSTVAETFTEAQQKFVLERLDQNLYRTLQERGAL